VFLPTTVVMGTMSLRLSEPLIMRFGARRTLIRLSPVRSPARIARAMLAFGDRL
jgi:hypothetical protein